jgi:transposase
MNAYSKDLRLKVLSAIDRGIPRKEVADLFGVSLSTIKRRSYIQVTPVT